ncbi:uncharacterized protein [Triticum aestivum]|uniref:uncharacterized protein n=1 Tax=Triticum aestivum TaxID=4565 RepID=UPI001D02F359|nr:uncharacterized protein LOC123125103 [Triticum aestivum]XP_044401574.1 uncharacterized protein LOC123125103 [Triticum aestivum]
MGSAALSSVVRMMMRKLSGQHIEEERDASIICHVHHTLRHYSATNPGSNFVPVKPLMAAYVGFQSHIWAHVSFVARRKKNASRKRRRNQANDTDKTFFAELRYSHHHSGAPTVEACAIIEKSSSHSHLKTACAFCPKSFYILQTKGGVSHISRTCLSCCKHAPRPAEKARRMRQPQRSRRMRMRRRRSIVAP